MADNGSKRGLRRLKAFTFPLVVGVAAAALALLAGSGCDALPGGVEGNMSQNIQPAVEFTNVPADGDTFAFAPVLYWKGRDPDGFVETYSYADVIDATALSDPEYYIDFIPEETWVTTEATSDTVYLLTETGEVTEHVFYLKCTDDRGAESPVIYRTFYRTNQPPRVPEIKWFSDPDYTYANDIPHPDSLNQTLNDTLYCLDQLTPTWQGLGFTWKSSDPNDSELYSIPLEYRYYLEKVPHDTVWRWVAEGWSNQQDIRIAGLETGHYTFTVWARDDGFELSERPATATFDVYEPTFEQSILLLNTTDMDASPRPLQWNLIPGDPIADLYLDMTASYPDADYLYYQGGMPLYKSLLGRYRLVIWFSENQRNTAGDDQFDEDDLVDYVRIGGRLWVQGILVRKNMITNHTLNLAESSFGGPASGVSIPSNEAEFAGAISGVSDLPDLNLDTTRTGAIYRQYFTDRRDSTKILYGVYPLLPGVDIITAGSGVETAYYFKSYTDTASGDVFNEQAEVRASVDTIYYPPTPVECIIALARNRVNEITRIYNQTRDAYGTAVIRTNNVLVGNKEVAIARVSYDYGVPWGLNDSVFVDYTYDPFSEFHMKPCAIRYEYLAYSGEQSYEVLYRVAVFTFPLYFMDDNQQAVRQMFNSMLNWFFLPFAH